MMSPQRNSIAMRVAISLRVAIVLGAATAVVGSPLATAQENHSPKPVPFSRQEMLTALDALKHRQPRLPLPPSDPESASGQSAGTTSGLGIVNNARMRALYLPPELHHRRTSGAAAGSPFPYQFATELFWIVSRVNNCQYCLGHQESKLKRAGVSEATLLALDTDWSSFSPSQRAAFAFARQLTHAPHTIRDQDIDKLRAHYRDDEILELTFLVSRYNSTNRWTDSLGIPQEEQREFSSTLELAEATKPSHVAIDGFAKRPAITDFVSWRAELEQQATRRPRLVPATIAPSSESMQPHERLLASIPAAGEPWVKQLRNARLVGTLPVDLRDKIAFVAAREDRAWYMQQLSRMRLRETGMSDQAIFELGTRSAASAATAEKPAEALALKLARQLTIAPQSITDADIERLSSHFSAEQIAEFVYHTATAAMLNRLSETAGLGFPAANPATDSQ